MKVDILGGKPTIQGGVGTTIKTFNKVSIVNGGVMTYGKTQMANLIVIAEKTKTGKLAFVISKADGALAKTVGALVALLAIANLV